MDMIKGLLCRLYIPWKREEMDWTGLLTQILPHVSGFVLDPPFWRFPNHRIVLCPKGVDDLSWIIERIPPGPWILVRITGITEEATLKNLERLDAALRESEHRERIVWLDTPLAYRNNRGLPHFVESLTRLTDRPFVLENAPERVKPHKKLGHRGNIRTSVMKKLALLPALAGLIHCGSLRRALDYSRATSGRRNFSILDGHEDHFLEYPNTTGLVSITANIFPRHWSSLVIQPRKQYGRSDDSLNVLSRIRSMRSRLGNMTPLYVAYHLYQQGVLWSTPPEMDSAVTKLFDDLYRAVEEQCTGNC